MRINKYLAQATGISRRAADRVLLQGKVTVNGIPAATGVDVGATDTVMLNGRELQLPASFTTIMLNKPVGYVCSRDGQGSRTVYELLPPELHHLKTVGRLDKHSSGLLLMTTDGNLAYELTHPKFEKVKKYKIALNTDLTREHLAQIAQKGVVLEDGISRFDLESINNQTKEWKVQMTEGRNRQIRRTFEALGYNVVKLHRTHFGTYQLGTLQPGKFTLLDQD